MNKKIMIISTLAVFTLVSISFASATNSNTETNTKNKESPLYKIRTNRAIGKNLRMIIDYIKTKFFGERIFFLPFQWIDNKGTSSIRDILVNKEWSEAILCTYGKTEALCTCHIPSCVPTNYACTN